MLPVEAAGTAGPAAWMRQVIAEQRTGVAGSVDPECCWESCAAGAVRVSAGGGGGAGRLLWGLWRAAAGIAQHGWGAARVVSGVPRMRRKYSKEGRRAQER